jgi:hypothetical protein
MALLERRHFLMGLATGVSGALAAAFLVKRSSEKTSAENVEAGEAPHLSKPAKLPKMRLDDLVQDSFAPHLHSTFRLSAPEFEPIDVELIQITGQNSAAPSGKRLECYSLTFAGRKKPSFRQQLCTVSHEKMGAFELFLVAVGPQQDSARYEAVFNRIS